MAARAKRPAKVPGQTESVGSMPVYPDTPPSPSLDDLARVAYGLDELASDMQATLNSSMEIGEQLEAAARAAPAAAHELEALASDLPLRAADARLSIARILARRAIAAQRATCKAMRHQGSGKCTGWSPACTAFDLFSAAHKLDDSGQDIVATAILMPKDDFRSKVDQLGDDIRKLAIDFRVPIGAVALRRRILQLSPE